MSDARTPLRAACVQLNAARPLDDVLATAGDLVERAAASGATLVVLPEKWNAIGPKERMLEAGEDLTGPTVAAMQGWAREHGIWLVGGSISERLEGENRIRNLSLAFDPAGSLVASLPQAPHVRRRGRRPRGARVEHRPAGRGARRSPSSRGWQVGLTVCYDLRFPELYRALAVAGAEVFTVPAGFMLHTGRDHWEILLRARAIENGAYVIAPNQHGSWDGNRMFGRSMIIDPWGVVIANASDGDGSASPTSSRPGSTPPAPAAGPAAPPPRGLRPRRRRQPDPRSPPALERAAQDADRARCAWPIRATTIRNEHACRASRFGYRHVTVAEAGPRAMRSRRQPPCCCRTGTAASSSSGGRGSGRRRRRRSCRARHVRVPVDHDVGGHEATGRPAEAAVQTRRARGWLPGSAWFLDRPPRGVATPIRGKRSADLVLK